MRMVRFLIGFRLANMLCQSPLRNVLDLKRTSVLLCRSLLVCSGMRHYCLLNLMVCNKFTMRHIIVCSVVCNNCKVFYALLNNSIDNLYSTSNSKKTAEHNSHSVMNPFNGLL